MKSRTLFALGVILACFSVRAALAAAQKPTPPSLSAQDKLKEQVDVLDSRMKAAEEKTDLAALEKDYVERIQKQYEAYYEKAFNTQLAIVTIIGLFAALAGKFGVDHIIQSKLSEAATQLRTEFALKLEERFQKLETSNAAQMKQLQEALEERIDGLKADVKIRSDFQFQFAQALASDADERYPDGRSSYRLAITVYKRTRTRELLTKKAASIALQNLFFSFFEEDEPNHLENAKRELEDTLYDGLDEESALASLELQWLAPLVKERKDGAPPAPTPITPHPQPAPAQ